MLTHGCVLQEHAGERVTATKRWWACTCCSHRFATVATKYPSQRCPNPRWGTPSSCASPTLRRPFTLLGLRHAVCCWQRMAPSSVGAGALQAASRWHAGAMGASVKHACGCRCPRPDSDFKQVAMGRAGPEGRALPGAEAPVAAREHFKPRGQEHGFALNA